MNDLDAEPFRYIRLREPPYSDDELARARRERSAPPAYVYFRHEDEPTAPAYAARLRELLSVRRTACVTGRRRPAAAAASSRRGSPRASSTATPTIALAAEAAADARKTSADPRRASRGRTKKWWNAPHARASATSEIFTSSTTP